MSGEPITIKEPLCAFCRHWMLGSLSLSTRNTAGVLGKTCPCHVKQPMETKGTDTCSDFEKAELVA